MKKLKIRLEIKLTQVYLKKKSRFPSPSRSTAKKGQSGLICIRSSRLSKDFFNRPKVLQEIKTKIGKKSEVFSLPNAMYI